MKNLFIFTVFLSLTSLVQALEADLSGNLEVQGRQSWNNSEAKHAPFSQDWSNENFYLAYGNLNGAIHFRNSKIEANWFVRHSYSELYENNYLDKPAIATHVYTFPNRLVARDVFKLQYEKQENNYKTESVLNKFFYEWSYEEHRFIVGRMYINYGLGEIFNPINPFNQPTGLTQIQQVAQGNDGFAVTFFISDQYRIDFYLLGDKRIEGYEGQIDKTLWAHGEYQYSDKLQLDYVIGEDQNRQKLGGQIAYQFERALVFSQLLYQTGFVQKNLGPSHNLWDILLGYDQQITNKWHLRVEAGYQERDQHSSLINFGERFLPTEYFVALANSYEVHPLVKLGGTIINDVKSGFTYLIAKSTFSLMNNMEAEIFSYVPVAKGDSVDNPAQNLVTTDMGLALRAFF